MMGRRLRKGPTVESVELTSSFGESPSPATQIVSIVLFLTFSLDLVTLFRPLDCRPNGVGIPLIVKGRSHSLVLGSRDKGADDS